MTKQEIIRANDLFFVYALDKQGNVIGEKRITNRAKLQHCAYCVCSDYGVNKAHYNKADFCLDGYLVQGDYQGTIEK